MLRPVPEPDDGGGRKCPVDVCDGSGWILREDGEAEPCACRERMISRAVSRGMGTGIPRRFRGVSFERKPICDLDPFVLRPVRDYVRNIAGQIEQGRGLWFFGDVGTGKTSLAMLVAQQALDQGFSVAVYSVPRLLAELRDTFEQESRKGSFLQTFERLTSVDLLLLDDLGAERQTDWVLEQLYAVVNERWQDGTPIVVTSNASDKDTPVARLRKQLSKLEAEIAELQRVRTRGGTSFSTADLDRSIARVETVVQELGGVAAGTDSGPLAMLRDQIGSRTVSRLVEICDDPLPILGPDLRMSAG